MTEQPSVKDQQVDSVLNPKTEADEDVIELFRIANRIGQRHTNDAKYLKVFALVTASGVAINRMEGTLNQDMVEAEARRITDEFWNGARE